MASLFKSLFGNDPERLLKKAEAHAAAGHWGDARLALGKALSCFSDAGDPRMKAVERRYQEVSLRLACAHEEEGDHLSRSGLVDRAMERYQLALGLFETDADRRRVEEKIDRKPSGDRAAPLKLFGESHCGGVQCHTPQPEASFEGDPLDYFEVLMHTLEPSVADAYRGLGEPFALGYAWMNQGDAERAIEYYERAALEHSGQGLLHKELGRTHLLRGDTDDAAVELTKAHELMPHDREAALLLVSALAEKKDHEAAFQILETVEADSADDDHIEVAQFRGDILFKSGDIDGAKDAYQGALGMGPDRPALYSGLARCAAALGDRPAAMAHYGEAVARGTNRDDIVALVDLMVEEGETMEAVMALLESALQRDPKNTWCYLVKMGEICIGAGRHDDAGRILVQAYDMIPGNEESIRAQVGAYLDERH